MISTLKKSAKSLISVQLKEQYQIPNAPSSEEKVDVLKAAIKAF